MLLKGYIQIDDPHLNCFTFAVILPFTSLLSVFFVSLLYYRPYSGRKWFHCVFWLLFYLMCVCLYVIFCKCCSRLLPFRLTFRVLSGITERRTVRVVVMSMERSVLWRSCVTAFRAVSRFVTQTFRFHLKRCSLCLWFSWQFYELKWLKISPFDIGCL